MKVGEQALYLAQLKGLPKKEALDQLVYWFRKFEIESWWDRKVEELSKGMQQKVQFITTIIHKPELLILDEPFTGFDPINTNIIKQEILNLKKDGTTIILSTHNMESVEEICDDIVLINKAKKVLEGHLVDIKQDYKNHQFEVAVELFQNNPEDLINAELYTIINSSQDENLSKLRVQLHDNVSGNLLLKHLLPIANIVTFKEILPSMNEIFIKQVNETK